MKIMGKSSAVPAPVKSGGGGSGSVDTLIGQNTVIMGDVQFTGGLHVDGTIRGRVFSDGGAHSSLSVSESGCIEGNVQVATILLNGTVTGDVQATEKITLAAKARVTGNVFYKILEMQGGAQVNGKLLHAAEPGSFQALTRQVDDEEPATVIEVSEVRRMQSAT